MLKRLLLALGIAGTPNMALPQPSECSEPEEQVSEVGPARLTRDGPAAKRRFVIDVGANWDDATGLWSVSRPVGLSAEGETFSLLIRTLQTAVPGFLEKETLWPKDVGEISFVVNNQVRILISRPSRIDSSTAV